MYAIQHLCHRTDIDIGRHGFLIDLPPEWKAAVSASDIDQTKADRVIEVLGRQWLDCTGHDRKFGNGYLYEPRTSIRVQWGEWGLEHISVPGNACGLDIDRDPCGCLWPDGARLQPHNLDSWQQKYLLLIVFTWFASAVILDQKLYERKPS